MSWPKPSDELREKLRKEIHRWKPWEHARKVHSPEWAAHLQSICKKVDGYYSLSVAEDKRRLREAILECEMLVYLKR
jgi:acetoin utilization deacetylase AcuC-like enzyme